MQRGGTREVPQNRHPDRVGEHLDRPQPDRRVGHYQHPCTRLDRPLGRLEHAVGTVGDVRQIDRAHARRLVRLVGGCGEQLHPLEHRQVGRGAHQLVVFDEVDAAQRGGPEDRRCVGRRQPRARLEHVQQQRTIAHPGELAQAAHPEPWAGELALERLRQLQVDQLRLHRGGRVVADQGVQQLRQARPEVDRRKRQGGVVTDRAGQPSRGVGGWYRQPCTTRPSCAAFSSAVRPGTSTQVPVVCPTANLDTRAHGSTSASSSSA